jgi:hypothetical protein
LQIFYLDLQIILDLGQLAYIPLHFPFDLSFVLVIDRFTWTSSIPASIVESSLSICTIPGSRSTSFIVIVLSFSVGISV